MGDEDVCRLFGAAVRRRREALGLSQEGLAEKAGVHRTYIGGIERGERNVTLRVAVKVARALATSFASLVKDVR